MLIQRYQYKTCDRVTVDGQRHYLTPTGERVPSVTTILDRTKPAEAREALAAWRKNIGEERARSITTEAANRGTRMHKYLEDYIQGQPLKESVSNPYAQESLDMAKTVIAAGFGRVDEIWGNEVPLYFPELYAGTTDSVGVHAGQPSILDFKQSNKPKKLEYIQDYFLQITAYALAHNELFGTNIRRGVIMVCVKPKDGEPPTYQEFVLEPQDFDQWTELWCDRVSEYYRLR
jgi:hypothetical protein